MSFDQIIKGIIQLVGIGGGIWLIFAWKGGQIMKVILGFFIIGTAIAMLRGTDIFSVAWAIVEAILKCIGFAVKKG
jgi:hypothetical protein